MGLFNSGKSEKVKKVEKYEEHHEMGPSKNHPHRSSKHQPNKYGAIIRPMPQASFIPNLGYSQFKYPFSTNIPFDLSKLASPSIPYQQFYPNQFPPAWSNGFNFYNDRTAYQQPNPWSFIPPSTNAYMPPMNF